MASSPSSSNPNNHHRHIPNVLSPLTFDPNLPTNTTFVQADPTTFRAVVQKLTGAPAHDPTSLKLPLSARLAGKSPAAGELGPRRQPFKLHERRQISARKLPEIKLSSGCGPPFGSDGSRQIRAGFMGFEGEREKAAMVSPVSTLDMLLARGSPRTPHSMEEEEERAIAEKGYYLHRSPLSTPRSGSGSEPPELLPLFPLHSPRDL